MKKTIILLVVLLLALSCGKKEVKKEKDTFETETAKETMLLAETVRKAFVDGDKNRIKELSTENGYSDVIKGTKIYDSVELVFTPRWIEIEKEKILLNIAWKSSWKISGRTSDERGMAVFVMEGRPLKLSRIMNANPFVRP